MNRTEIIKSVNAYIKNDHAKYALLINGAWGVGKTYLYEKYLSDAISSIEAGKNNRKVNIYISLYGISSVDALSKQLITNYLIYDVANGNDIAKKTIKPVSGAIGILSKAISFSVGPAKVELKGVSDVINIFKAKDMVICFDDLERCSIPIWELFGFVNNLIEHCNCKVLILADENNIGKTFANTNVELKYKTLLTGNRKVVQEQPDKKKNTNDPDILTIKQLKELNELLYSENYIYRDIKEKVIGKTLYYSPDIKDTIIEIISGTADDGYIKDNEYKEFLNSYISDIVSYFSEANNKNVRIIMAWIDLYEPIFRETYKNLNKSKYYENIVADFMRYSIWSVVSLRKNIRLMNSAYYGNAEYVHFEGKEYVYTCRYGFIDRYIINEHLDVQSLVQAARTIELRCEREKLANKNVRIQSKGIELGKLYGWKCMDDADVEFHSKELLKELKDGKYAYKDYADILALLVFFKRVGLYSGKLATIQKSMLALIDMDTNVQEESGIPQSFSNAEDKEEFKRLYAPIAAKRKERNVVIDKTKILGKNIYKNADTFYNYCELRKDFYSEQRSFMEYIEKEKLLKLIEKSDLEGVYDIADTFSAVYYMGNLKDFFMADVDDLREVEAAIDACITGEISGITRKIALEYLHETIKEIIRRLS